MPLLSTKRILIFILLITLGLLLGGWVKSNSTVISNIEKTNTHQTIQTAPKFKKIDKVTVEHRLHHIPMPKQQRKLVQRILQQLQQEDQARDWEASLKSILENVPDDMGRVEVLSLFFSMWIEHDFSKALRAMSCLGHTYRYITYDIINSYANDHPKEFISEVPRHAYALRLHDAAIEIAIQAFANENPESLFQWSQSDAGKAMFNNSAQGHFLREITLSQLLLHIEPKSPLAQQCRDFFYQNYGSLPQKALMIWATQDPNGAESWLKTQPNANKNDFASLYAGWTMNDPNLVKQALNSLPDDKRENYINLIAYDLRDENLDLDFIIEHKEQITEEDISRVRDWTRVSPEKAYEWIQSLESVPIKDQAINLYVQELISGSVPSYYQVPGALELNNPYLKSLETIRQINDDELRKSTEQIILEHWKSNKPFEFKQWKKKIK